MSGKSERMRTVTLPMRVYDRVARLKIVKREALYAVIERVLDERDAGVAASSADPRGPGRNATKTSALRAFGRSITGRDPHDNQADGASAAALPSAEVAA